MKRIGRTRYLLAQILAVPLLASVIACRSREGDSPIRSAHASEPPPVDSEGSNKTTSGVAASRSELPSAISTPVSLSARPLPRFEMFKVQNRKTIAELESRLGADAFAAVLKINRIDKRHIRVGDSLILPGPSADATNISPFPAQLEAAREIPKLILVSRRLQAFGAYESGKLVRWGPTSTGKKSTPTPAGLYHANWKAKRVRSTVNASWVLPWCFNLDNFAGVSFHQFDLPGYPASHGCVRLLEDDAKWIYDWADQWLLSKVDRSMVAYGTPVVIFGEYAYGEKPAWKRLAEDPSAAVLSDLEIQSALEKHLAMIESRTRVRLAAIRLEVARPDRDARL